MANAKKCNCGLGNFKSCKNCSKIRMVILLKNGFEHLKHKTPDGKLVNPVWYSILKKNSKPVVVYGHKSEIIPGMLERLRKHASIRAVNQVRFYDNQTKTHLHTEII